MNSTKHFDTDYHRNYYKNWVYLGTIDNQDYYIQSLPSATDPFPSTSVVFGEEPHEYISTTVSIESMLNDEKALKTLEFYIKHKALYYGIHMIAFVRNYAEKMLNSKNS
jgi:hypothetical protein